MYNKSVVAISKFPSTMEDCLTNIPTVCVEKDRLVLFVSITVFIYLFIFNWGKSGENKRKNNNARACDIVHTKLVGASVNDNNKHVSTIWGDYNVCAKELFLSGFYCFLSSSKTSFLCFSRCRIITEKRRLGVSFIKWIQQMFKSNLWELKRRYFLKNLICF